MFLRLLRRACGAWLLLVSVAALTACGGSGGDNNGGGGGGNGDTTPPTVTSTGPTNGATGVPNSTGAITATFSEAMNAASLSATTFTLSSPGGLVSGSVSYSGKTATFAPGSPLSHGTTYTATIAATAADAAGNSLGSSHSWSFTTATRPSVVSNFPSTNATGVATNTVVQITFNKNIDCDSVTGGFSINGGVGGTIECVEPTTTVTIKNAALDYDVTYTATATTGITDTAGNSLAANHEWSFTTVVFSPPLDNTPPTVSATSPASGASGVAINSSVSVTFSEVMNPATITADSFQLIGPGGAVAGNVVYSGLSATFTPAASLDNSASYSATVTTGVADTAGNSLASNYQWTFTTAAAVDTTAPTVTSTTPADGDTGISKVTAMTASFSEALDPSTLTPLTFKLRRTSDGASVSGNVVYGSGTAVFTPLAALDDSTNYTATLTTGVKDASGNSLAANYEWSFDTAAAADTTAPTVVLNSESPQNNASNVPVGSVISATFSEPMNPATLNTATFFLSPAVSGTVSYTGDTVRFTPNAQLTSNQPYNVTITSDATDLAGNPLAANYVWNFTTLLPPDETAPTVTTTSPPNSATNVASNAVITATFDEQLSCSTVNGASFSLIRTIDNVPVAGSVTCAGNTATFTPSSRLTGNTGFTATLSSAITDLAGNTLALTSWSFTTAVVPWNSRLGTASNDTAEAIASDGSGNVVVAGSTQGAIGDSATSAGGWDAYIAKLDPAGTKLWAQQFGSAGDDLVQAVATDSGGNVYVAGYTLGNLDGASSGSTVDLFVAKYSPAGAQLWVRQFGTNLNDYAHGISVDGGNVYVVGYTFGALDGQVNSGNGDALLIRYDADGNRLWTRLLGTSAEDVGRGVATDVDGNVYVAGFTLGTLPTEVAGGAYDYFIARYDASGTLQWARQFGTLSSELAHGIAVSGSAIYISGHTSVSTLIAKHATVDGTNDWARNLSSPAGQHNRAVEIIAAASAVYAAGWTDGSVDGNTGSGAHDLFLVKYDTAGTKQWSRQFGSGADDFGLGIATDGNGDVFVTGYTLGDLDGNSNFGSGTSDPFVLKFSAAGAKQ